MQAAFRRNCLIDAALSNANLKPGVQGEKRALDNYAAEDPSGFSLGRKDDRRVKFARRFTTIEATNSETEISGLQWARSFNETWRSHRTLNRSGASRADWTFVA